MRIIVTGAAGFIGSHVVKKLLSRGYFVVGIDNHNDYYDVSLKESRVIANLNNSNYVHKRVDISEKEDIFSVFDQYEPDGVINLAAQAGVRYSITNPLEYVRSNLVGFSHILEASRIFKIKHLVYASSSSVYGSNSKVPFSVADNVDHPVSLYAATKKSNELMAHAYSHLYDIPSSGLRFFTVYGPWGRPDMAPMKFAEAIVSGKEIQVYNYGNHRRDFTYIDDIVDGVIKVYDNPPKRDANWNSNISDPGSSSAPWRVFNIGNGQPVNLMDFISCLEKELGKKAILKFLPMQPGDVLDTWAENSDLIRSLGYSPNVSIEIGVKKFVEWYRDYYKY